MYIYSNMFLFKSFGFLCNLTGTLLGRSERRLLMADTFKDLTYIHMYRAFIKYYVFIPRISNILRPLHHWAFIVCTEKGQPIRVTVHSHLLRGGGVAVNLEKNTIFNNILNYYCMIHVNFLERRAQRSRQRPKEGRRTVCHLK